MKIDIDLILTIEMTNEAYYRWIEEFVARY
jgi:hypothetical protein